jgi:DNA-directed RNA polymerase specialized sigma24 family protein
MFFKQSSKKEKEFQESEELRNLNHFLEEIKSKYNVDTAWIFSKISKEEYIPVSIFTKKLSPLEIVVKYLKENKQNNYVEIGKKLNRSEKTIWQAYSNSKKKLKKKFIIKKIKYPIPVKVLSDRKLTVFEIIVAYLVEYYNLTYSEIAGLLKRDQRTIWTTYQRALKKQ